VQKQLALDLREHQSKNIRKSVLGSLALQKTSPSSTQSYLNNLTLSPCACELQLPEVLSKWLPSSTTIFFLSKTIEKKLFEISLSDLYTAKDVLISQVQSFYSPCCDQFNTFLQVGDATKTFPAAAVLNEALSYRAANSVRYFQGDSPPRLCFSFPTRSRCWIPWQAPPKQCSLRHKDAALLPHTGSGQRSGLPAVSLRTPTAASTGARLQPPSFAHRNGSVGFTDCL